MANVQRSDQDDPDFAGDLRAGYESMLHAIDLDLALALDFGAARFGAAVRRATDRSADPLMPAKAADRWLAANVGPVNDPLRRAAVAALALGLKPDVRVLTGPLIALYPAMHARMVRFLDDAHAYDVDVFAKDVGMAAGAAAPAGAFTVTVPSPGAARITGAALQRAAAGLRRQQQQRGVAGALEWLKAWGFKPWIELHVDVRNLEEFNVEGFLRSYHRLAGLLVLRPELAGVYGASWLYQPELSAISPNLAFARETAEAGGGRLVRLRADPVQTAFAIARSSTRRKRFMSGEYQPVCYGMFWDRRTLIDWSRAEQAKLSQP